MYKLILAGLACSLLAACATTDTSVDAAQGQVAPAEQSQSTDLAASDLDPNAEVCRRVQQTGTRFHTRICKTRAEWEEEARQGQDATTRMQRTIEPNTPNGR